ncbi:hypothetical protein BH24CHL10_BH24CHL10_01370 [soil metagenome]
MPSPQHEQNGDGRMRLVDDAKVEGPGRELGADRASWCETGAFERLKVGLCIAVNGEQDGGSLPAFLTRTVWRGDVPR